MPTIPGVPLSAECAMRYPSAWVRRFLPLVKKGGHVLDLACGAGRHTAWMLMRGFRVTAADIDLTEMEGLRGAPGLTLEAHDLEGAPWPWGEAVFDGVVVTNYLYRPHYPAYWRSLTPGGIFIQETFSDANALLWGRPRNAVHRLTPGELIRLAPEGARIIAFEEGIDRRGFGIERIVWAKPGANVGEGDGARRLCEPETHFFNEG